MTGAPPVGVPPMDVPPPRVPMTTLTKVLLAAAAVIALVLLGVGLDRCGSCSGPPVIVTDGIDAGPGETAIAARLDASVQAEEAHIRELEAAHAKQIAAFDEQDQAAYAAQKARGRAALAAWLAQRSRALLDAGP